MTDRLSAQDWIDFALKTLAREGFQALKADVLARKLGVQYLLVHHTAATWRAFRHEKFDQTFTYVDRRSAYFVHRVAAVGR